MQGMQGIFSSGLSGFFVTPTSQCCASRPEGTCALHVDTNHLMIFVVSVLRPAMAKSSGTQPRPKSELAHQGMNWMVLAQAQAAEHGPAGHLAGVWMVSFRKRYRTGLRLTGDIADFGAIFAFVLIANTMVFVWLVP